MKLLFITTCDKFGSKEHDILHYWDDDINEWRPVQYFECKDDEYDEIIKDASLG